MLGDIGDPQLVGIMARNVAFNQVVRGGNASDPSESRPSSDSGPSYEHLHRVVADGSLVAIVSSAYIRRAP